MESNRHIRPDHLAPPIGGNVSSDRTGHGWGELERRSIIHLTELGAVDSGNINGEAPVEGTCR